VSLETSLPDSMELLFDLDKTQDNAGLFFGQKSGSVNLFTAEEEKRFRLDQGAETGPTLWREFFALCGETERHKVQEPPHLALSLDIESGPTDLGQFDVLYNKTQEQLDPITPLRMAAEANDEKRFVTAMRFVNWSQLSATDFFNVVHLALEAGAHLTARRLAIGGFQRYPRDPALRRMYQFLRAPQVLNADLPPVPSLKANRHWMQTHATKYRGQWVALKDGGLVASAPTVYELKARVGDLEDHFITRIF
jgi:hypothetical protein